MALVVSACVIAALIAVAAAQYTSPFIVRSSIQLLEMRADMCIIFDFTTGP